ncbi:MAG: metallopeptidase TldD-related protein [Thermoanaerobaculia bacterium]|nr:metallopeptidase TldD-related protein [Thermoanaerobaculia bacterium]
MPGSASEEELLAEAAGGIWIGEIGRVELFDPPRLGARFAARGVRRIDPGGALAAPLPDLGWEGSLAELLGAVAGVGRQTVCRPLGIGWMGGAVAPCLRLGRLPGRCRPLPGTA